MNATDLADAYVKVARANHYLVYVASSADLEDLRDAEQILITRDNAADNLDAVLGLALDLIEHDIRCVLASDSPIRRMTMDYRLETIDSAWFRRIGPEYSAEVLAP